MAGRPRKSAKKPEALDKFKYEVANELGVSLDKDNVTSKDAGKVGGNMVKKMIQQAESQLNK